MKQLIYVTCLGFLSLGLFSCQEENVVPAAAETPSVAKVQPAACTIYSYESKTGTVSYGTAYNRELMVGFDSTLTLAQRAAILAKYKPYSSISYEMPTESGLLTAVNLKVNTTCQDVDQLIRDLLLEPTVQYALPAFANGSFWNEFFVVLSNSGTERHLQQMVLATNTRIVGYPIDYGAKTYVLSADKNSTGNVFAMLTYFNASSRVAYAEPTGFIYPLQFPKGPL